MDSTDIKIDVNFYKHKDIHMYVYLPYFILIMLAKVQCGAIINLLV